MKTKFEKELNEIKEVVKNFKNDDTIEVSIENNLLYVRGKRSYVPLNRTYTINEENDILLSYGSFYHNGKLICEKEYIGRLSNLGLDQWPVCKTITELVRKLAA